MQHFHLTAFSFAPIKSIFLPLLPFFYFLILVNGWKQWLYLQKGHRHTFIFFQAIKQVQKHLQTYRRMFPKHTSSLLGGLGRWWWWFCRCCLYPSVRWWSEDSDFTEIISETSTLELKCTKCTKMHKNDHCTGRFPSNKCILGSKHRTL